MLTKLTPSWSNPGLSLTFASLIRGLVILLLFSGSVIAQELTLVGEFADIEGFIGEDQMGSKYVVTRGVLKKIDADSRVYSYSNKQFGPVTSVDISDPLNVLVFFRDFGVVVMLDKNLSEKKVIAPQQLHDHDLPALICSSANQGFWGYFPDVGRLIRFSSRPTREIISEDLHLLFGRALNPKQLFESNDKLFLVDNGVWVFDLFANFLFKIDYILQPAVQVKGNKIFFMKENTLCVYDFFLNQETLILLPEKGVKSFHVKNNQTIYLQTDHSLKKYLFAGEFF
jgi:hypothetical protein